MRRWFLIGLLLIASGVAAQDTTLTVHWLLNEQDPPEARDLLREQIAAFEAENPGTSVNLRITPWAIGREVLTDGVVDGNPADLAVLGARWVPELVADGLIEPLDDYLTPDFRAQFFQSMIEEGSVYQGRTFGLPVAASTRAMVFNRALFDEAGLDYPDDTWTWEDLRAASVAIGEMGEGVYGFGLQGGDQLETNTYFYYFVWGNEGTLYNPSVTASALDSDLALEALTFLDDLADAGGVQPNPTDPSINRRALEDMFIEGNLGMMITGNFALLRLRRGNPNLDFGVAPIPFNRTPATYGVIDAMVMLSTSRNKEAAWALMEHLYAPERRRDYTQTMGFLPVMAVVAEDPEFTLAEDEQFATFLSLLPNARFEPLNVNSEEIAQTVIDAVRDVYAGGASPEAALQNAASTIDGVLASNATGW